MDALRFLVVDHKFGSRVMNGISKDVAQRFIVVVLFMMVMMLLVAMVMLVMVCFSFVIVVVRHKAVDQR